MAEARSKSEDWHYSLFSKLPDAVFVRNKKGRILEANPAACKLLDQSLEDLLNSSWKDIASTKPKVAHRKKLGQPPEYARTSAEYHLSKKDHTKIPVSIRLINVQHDSEAAELVIARDMSHENALVKALDESEKRYRQLVDDSLHGVAIIQDRQYVYVNPAFAKTVGFSAKEMLPFTPDDIWALIHPDDKEGLEQRNKDLEAGKPLEPRHEFRYIRPDGTVRWVEAFGRSIKHRDRPAMQVLEIDITEQKIAEEKLRASEQRYRKLIADLPEGVAIVGLDETLQFVNDTFQKIVGYNEDEIIGTSILDIVEPTYQDTILAQTQRRKDGESSAYEVVILKKAGNQRLVRISAVPMVGDDGKVAGTVAVFSDITEGRRMLEEKLQQQRETQLYGQLMRHDLGNDLQAVLGYVEAASMLVESMPDAAKDMIDSAVSAAGRMADLVKAFGTPQEELETDLVSLIQHVASQAEKKFKDLKVKVEVEKKGKNLRIIGSGLLPIAFHNIFENSAEHAGTKPLVITHISKGTGYADIMVWDNGPGVPDERRRRIFQRGGTIVEKGMGLYLTRQIVIASGGSIELLPKEKGKGARFRLIIPLAV